MKSFIVILCVAWLSIALGAANRADASSETLKVLNWNVLFGFNHHKSLDRGVAWIKEHGPDVAAFQELNGHNASQFEKIAGRWGHQHSAILKERGFPVGLTSNAPIEVIERRIKGFHHGYMHCKTHGTHFVIVHFWPTREREATIIIEKIRPVLDRGEPMIVLGDFNATSLKDTEGADAAAGGKVGEFEAVGFVDLSYRHSPDTRYSFPSPIIIPRGSNTLDEVKAKRTRIDFIMANEPLASKCVSSTILISDELDQISDHYPVVAEFKWPRASGLK